MQDKCNSQAFSLQELATKLEKEVAQKRELERQLDEKAETCRQAEVSSQTATKLILYFYVTCMHVSTRKLELIHNCGSVKV